MPLKVKEIITKKMSASVPGLKLKQKTRFLI